jgi:hypothetical protein
MLQAIARYFLFFLAGIAIHMSFMHHFSFDRVKTHPLIRIWKSPRMAAAISGIIQFSMALLILTSSKLYFYLSQAEKNHYQ